MAVAVGVEAVPQSVVETSTRAVDAAMDMVRRGPMTAREALDLGCLSPECITVAALQRVADMTGTDVATLAGR